MHNDLKLLREICKNYTVLYAEDDIAAQEEIRRTLKRIFKEVYVAPDGKIALELFQQYQPDIIITDIQMPHMSGLELARNVKELSPTTPVILTTAFNEEQYFIKAIEEGIDSFILKPIDKEKFFNTILKNITQIDYQKKARESEEHQKIIDINQASEESIQSLANLFPFPAIFYKNNNLIFINTAAEKMLEEVKIESIQQETSFVSQFQIIKDDKQKIKLHTTNGLTKIYWIHPNAFFIGVDFDLVQTYIFVDITTLS